MSDTPKVFDECSRGPNRDKMDHEARIARLASRAGGGRVACPAGHPPSAGHRPSGRRPLSPRRQPSAGHPPSGRQPVAGRHPIADARAPTERAASRARAVNRARAASGNPETEGGRVVPGMDGERAAGVVRVSRQGESCCALPESDSQSGDTSVRLPQIRAKTATRRYAGNSTNLGWLRLVP
jgi:hypothetical protein